MFESGSAAFRDEVVKLPILTEKQQPLSCIDLEVNKNGLSEPLNGMHVIRLGGINRSRLPWIR